MMFKTCQATIKPVNFGLKRAKNLRIAQSTKDAASEICAIDSDYMYVHISGLHGGQKDTNPKSPGYDQYKGNDNCFTPETLITMADGSLKRIDEIKVGDEVLSAEGIPRKVLKLWVNDFDGKINEIKTKGSYNYICATDEHPFFGVKKNTWISSNYRWKWNSCKTYDMIRFANETRLKEISAKEIKKGDKLSRNIYQTTEITEDINNNDLAWFLGLYTAEGCCSMGGRKNKKWCQVEIYLHKDEVILYERLKEICQKHFNVDVKQKFYPQDNPHRNVMRCAIYSVKVAEWIKKYILGRKAKYKHLSSNIMKMPIDWQLAFLSGLLDGDGCLSKSKFDRQRIRLVTASPIMTLQIQMILDRANINSTTSKSRNNGNFSKQSKEKLWTYEVSVNASKDVKKLKNGSRIKIEHVKEATRNFDIVHWRGNSAIVSVTKTKKKKYKGKVYNLTVDVDHTYIANGLKVHNCDFFWWKKTLLEYKPKLGMHAFETWRGKDNLLNHDEVQVVGDIPDVWLDIPNKSVDMLVRTSVKRAWTTCQSIRNGQVTDTSMGVLVGHSYCSICNNRANSEQEWCLCMKHKKGQFLLPDELPSKLRDEFPKGKWCYEDNRDIYGIEISWITVGQGADPEAKVKNLIFDSEKDYKQGTMNKSIVDSFWNKYGRI